MSNRIDKINYYLNIAEQVATRGTCLRRNYGAIIVKNDEIISTGYVGAPRGRQNCCDIGKCIRNELNIQSGQRYEICRSVHAEMNAVISASRAEMIGATMYLVGFDVNTKEYLYGAEPCAICKRLIINAGIDKVVLKGNNNAYEIIDVQTWIHNDESLEGKTDYLKK